MTNVSRAIFLIISLSLLGASACQNREQHREQLDRQILSLKISAADSGIEVSARASRIDELNKRLVNAPHSRDELRCWACLSTDSQHIVDIFVLQEPTTKDEITSAIARYKEDLRKAESRLKDQCARLRRLLSERNTSSAIDADLPMACRT